MRLLFATALVASAFVLSTVSGASADYRPTGPLIADSGFRPSVDGYSFPNYGPGKQTSRQPGSSSCLDATSARTPPDHAR